MCVGCTEFIFAPGCQLETIPFYAICRLYSLEKLIIPSSVKNIESKAIVCMQTLKKLYICGNPTVGEDPLYDKYIEYNDIIAPPDLQIFVPLDFSGQFGSRTLTKEAYHHRCDLVIIKSCFAEIYQCNRFAYAVYAIFVLE